MKNQKKKIEYIETELHLVCHKLPPSNRKKKNRLKMSKPDFSTNILDWHWVRKAKQKKQTFCQFT